jgi:hypothetical protein
VGIVEGGEVDEAVYGASRFGYFGEYMRRKRAKLQIQNTDIVGSASLRRRRRWEYDFQGTVDLCEQQLFLYPFLLYRLNEMLVDQRMDTSICA